MQQKGWGSCIIQNKYTCTEIQKSQWTSPFESTWVRIKRQRNKNNTVMEVHYRLFGQVEDADEVFICQSFRDLQL